MTPPRITLAKAGLPTPESITRRILAVYDRATDADKTAGADWYPYARGIATALGTAGGRDAAAAAAVIAHLSPRTPWARNVAGAAELMIHGRRMAGIMRDNYARASAAWDHPEPLDTLKGPKVRPFARNLLGDLDAVTLDIWAARVAGVTETQLARVGMHEALAAAYTRAARRRGVTPAVMQATTWIVARNGRAN